MVSNFNTQLIEYIHMTLAMGGLYPAAGDIGLEMEVMMSNI